MSNDKIKESAEYDNFIGQKVDMTPVGLDAFGLEVTGVDPQSAEAHWVGMPEFEQNEQKPYKTLYVHFRTKEDYKNFADTICQICTDKTKSIWHPKNEVTKNSLLRWVEDDQS
jgi:hypothetical protein